MRQLAETGLEFEATLVKSEAEYASLLITREFDLIVVDELAHIHAPGSEHLSPFEIAREIATGVPFVLIVERLSENDEAGTVEEGLSRIPRQRLNLIGALMRGLQTKNITDTET